MSKRLFGSIENQKLRYTFEYDQVTLLFVLTLLIFKFFASPVKSGSNDMKFNYLLRALTAAPLLPLMYVQGKRIKKSVPVLPEATGPSGITGNGRPFKLLTIGESTIAGVGVDTHEEGFTGTLATTLAERLNRRTEWRVYARSGYTAQRTTLKLIPKITETEADLIVIGTGGNDAFTLNTPDRFRKHVSGLIDAVRLKFPNTPIVFTNMPPIKEFPAFTLLIKFTIGHLVELLGDEVEEEVKNRKNVHYYADRITIKDWTKRLNIQEKTGAFFSDGVHPSKLTYQTWAKDLGRWMVEEENVI